MPKPRRLRVCNVPRCPEYTHDSKCEKHRRQAEQQRGSARERGYDQDHESLFRKPVLQRDPKCVCTEDSHGHGTPCGQPSKHADHFPQSRRELQAAGLNPNDPRHGRGLCGPCHSSETAHHQPGGWNQ